MAELSSLLEREFLGKGLSMVSLICSMGSGGVLMEIVLEMWFSLVVVRCCWLNLAAVGCGSFCASLNSSVLFDGTKEGNLLLLAFV